MLFKKILIVISLTFTTLIQVANSYENRIILKIDREIVTNLDIKNEARYLSALNPKIMELDEDKIFDISKNSIIRENIKKIEILKNTNDFKVNFNYTYSDGDHWSNYGELYFGKKIFLSQKFNDLLNND